MKKNIFAIVVISMLAVPAFSADNSIYIDQAGDDAVITVLQDGSANRVRGIQGTGTGNTTPATIVGNGVKVDITQVGSNNTLNMGINSTISSGRSADVTYSTVDPSNISGSNNIATFNLNALGAGINSNTLINVKQLNGGNATDVNVLGTGNSITVVQKGGGAVFNTVVNADNTRQNIDTSGGTNNQVYTDLTSNNGQVDVTAVGASNTINITQNGAGGILGHVASLDITGTGNQVTLTQSGAIDNTFNLKISGAGSSAGGNNNTYNIIQRKSN
jgi:hypothetical protein